MAAVHAHPAVEALHADSRSDGASSPVLTKPDMILPYKSSRISSQPAASSPTSQHGASPGMRYANGLNSHPPKDIAPEEIGAAELLRPFEVESSVPPGFVASYTFYEHGAPLSDIGEEETTPKSRKTRSRTPSPPGSPLQQSQHQSWASQKNGNTKRMSERSLRSISSTGSDLGDWENFDTTNMISNGRLKADLARSEDDSTSLDGMDSRRSSTVGSGQVLGEEELAAQALSNRAERILATAKKRLTLMEGNLNKARESVIVPPKSSPILGEQQQIGGLYRSISQNTDRRSIRGSVVGKSRPLYPLAKSNSISHNRGASENDVPSKTYRVPRQTELRSASALELGHSGSIDTLLREPTSQLRAVSPGSTASGRSYHTPLRALKEDEGSPAETMKTTPEVAPRGLGISTQELSNVHTRKSSSGSSNGLARSHSSASTRSTQELKEQMNGLKTRITEIKSRTAEEKMRRRSLQAMRTPSPFTAAESWYAGSAAYDEGSSPLRDNAGRGWSPKMASEAVQDQPVTPRSPHDSAFGDGNVTPSDPARPPSSDHSSSRLSTRAEMIPTSPLIPSDSNYEDAPEEVADESSIAASEEEQIFLNEVLEESLREEPDVPAIPDEYVEAQEQSERHEDRADAFDYETFFLNSALGNYSKSGYHRRTVSGNTGSSRDSMTSTGSVETARMAVMTPTQELGKEDEDVEEEQQEGEFDRVDEDEESDDTEEHQFIFRDDESGLTPTTEEPTTPKGSDFSHQRALSDLSKPSRPFATLQPRSRSGSTTSISTMATFMTATEGGHDSEAESNTIPDDILRFGYSNPRKVPPIPIQAQTQQLDTAPPLSPARQIQISPRHSPRRVHSRASSLNHSPSLETISERPFEVDHESYEHEIRPNLPSSLSLSNGAPLTPPIATSPQEKDVDAPTPTLIPSPTSPATPSSTGRPSTSDSTSTTTTTTTGTTTSTTHPANTEILMASLITLADPTFRLGSTAHGRTSSFQDVDKDLVISLLRSVGAVCSNVMRSDMPDEDVWRRRLDAARRILDGEIEIDEEDGAEEMV